MDENRQETDIQPSDNTEKGGAFLDALNGVREQMTPEMFDEFITYSINQLKNNYMKDWQENEVSIQNKLNALKISFPNGTTNKEYSQTFDLNDEDFERVEFEGLEEIGLQWMKEEGINRFSIKGIPTVAGDYKLKMRCYYRGWMPGKNVLERVFHIAINPDPRSLWKSIPTPTDIEYYKADSATFFIPSQGEKVLVVASQRGRSHGHEGKPRDDDFKMDYNPETEWYVLAVADGAGSAKYSREGSRIACETVVAHCKECLNSPDDFEEYIKIYKQDEESVDNRKYVGDNLWAIVGNAAFKAHRAIKEEATMHGAQLKDYATTLLLTICKKFDFGWFVASFWVGDGAICIYDKENNRINLMGTPDGGEYAGQTRFLTMPEIFSDAAALYGRLKFAIVNDFSGLFLMTDGVSDPMFETDANLNRVEMWNNLWEKLDKEVDLSNKNEQVQERLLGWLDFWSPGNHDDRTIAILY
ncbi:MAG: protein phosphatase 2C domain-containing protein [Paludibacteraceae bacterium]|nr:protein phosphatase 2C domain-containing protein [Paludibacteraceae bacterium]